MKQVLLVCLIMLTACSSAPPTTVPTTTNAPEPSGPVAPTPAPLPPTPERPAELLPEPIYTLDQGQIFRIERDGITRVRLTRETTDIAGVPPIATFAVGPNGELAYVVGDLEADRLMITAPDGEHITLRYSEPQHELSDLLWTPDGQSLVLRLLNNRQPPDLPSGIYRLDRTSGALELLVADDPVDNVVNPARTIAAYRPFAWSPDGTQLLVDAYSPFYFTCGPAVLPATGGAVTRITLPAEVEGFCGEAAWTPDSTAIVFMAGEPNRPTLWQAQVADPVAAPLSTEIDLARAPFVSASGAVQFLAVTLQEQQAIFSMQRHDGTNQTTLHPPLLERPLLALWGADGSGMVALLAAPEGPITLRWIGADGQTDVSLPATVTGVTELHWAVR